MVLLFSQSCSLFTAKRHNFAAQIILEMYANKNTSVNNGA
jgi:hypothetical protein